MIRPLVMNTVSFRGTNLLEQFKEKQKAHPQHTDNQPQFDGAEAIANYNKGLINQQPAILNEIKPAEIVTIKGDEADTLQGEKVLRSDGTLEAIVVKGDKTTKEYHFFSDKLMDKIVEKDNESGKIIKEAQFGTQQNKLTSASVTEYGQNDDEKYTAFANGKLIFVTDKKNGQKRSIGYNEDGSVRLTSETDNANGMVKDCIYKDGKLESIVYYKDYELKLKTEYSPDGKEVTQYTNEKILVPDFDINKIKEEFKPADINSVKIPENIEALQGEKKFRSNGTLESIIVKGEGNKATEYSIDFDGKKILKGLEKENDKPVRDFSLDKEGKIFSINTFGDSDKTTYFAPNGGFDVSIIKDGIHKHVEFSKDGNVIYYNEWNPKTERPTKCVLLNENGEAIEYKKDTPDGYITVKKGLSED